MRILNFGSLNIDKVYRVPHFVRPGETIAALGYDTFWGGKGLNQSVAAARAGGRVWHAGAVGEDGEPLTAMLAECGADTSLVQRLPGVSGHALIQVSPQGENNIIVYGGANQALTGAYAAHAMEGFGPGDLLLLQNEVSAIPEAMAAARERGLTIAFNPSPVTEGMLAYPLELVDLFILNEIEAQVLTGLATREEAALLDALDARYPGREVVLTLGSRGACYRGGAQTLHQPAFPAKTVDTTAAGDTFTGFFLAARLRGEGPAQALREAAMAASIAVGRPGAAPGIPLLEEVLTALKNR